MHPVDDRVSLHELLWELKMNLKFQACELRAVAAHLPWSKRRSIGFVGRDLSTYGRAMASSRFRVFDPIMTTAGHPRFALGVYKPWLRYDAVIFQKQFDADSLGLAQRIKRRGSRIVLDINVNYYDLSSPYIRQDQYEDVMRFTEEADAVITSSEFLKEKVRSLFPGKWVVTIEENIPPEHFEVSVTPRNPPKSFVWAGHTFKSRSLEGIRGVLDEIGRRHGVTMHIIGGEAVDLGAMRVVTVPYRRSRAHRDLCVGDVFLAPRDLADPYNLGHAFTKIGVAMASGIPAVASPVPSYMPSPALLCDSAEDWWETLSAVARGDIDLEGLSAQGRRHAWERCRPDVVKADYLQFCADLLT